MEKIFRVNIIETLGFYVDVTAKNEAAACDFVRGQLTNPDSELAPIEDDTYYEGYQVQDAVEINSTDSDLVE